MLQSAFTIKVLSILLCQIFNYDLQWVCMLLYTWSILSLLIHIFIAFNAPYSVAVNFLIKNMIYESAIKNAYQFWITGIFVSLSN